MKKGFRRALSMLLSMTMVVAMLNYTPKQVEAADEGKTSLPTSQEITSLNAPKDVYLLDFRMDKNNSGYRIYFTDVDADVYTVAEGDTKTFDVYMGTDKIASVSKSGETISLEELNLTDGQTYEVTMKEVLTRITTDGTETLESVASVKNYFTYDAKGTVPVKVNNEDTGIAKVYITTSRDDKTKNHNLYTSGDKVDVKSSLIVENDKGAMEASGDGTIKLRGNSTSTGQKKPYNIKFSKKTNLFGFGSAKKWSLLANTFDKSLIRNQIGMQFHHYVEQTYQPDYAYSSQCEPVDVYLDGKYLGSYLLLESVEAGSSRVDIESDEETNDDILLELDSTGRDTNAEAHLVWDNTLTDLGMGFTINEPGEDIGNNAPQEDKDAYDAKYGAKKERVLAFINKCEAAMKDGGDGTLDEISKYIDVNSFVNYYISAELMRITDVGFSSVRYYVKDSGNWEAVKNGTTTEELYHDDKLYMGAMWDMDLSSGNADGAAANPANDMHAWNDNPYFKHLMMNAEFKALVVKRYEELLPKIHELVADGGTIDQLYNTLNKSATANYSDLAYNIFSIINNNEANNGYADGTNTGWKIDGIYTAGHHVYFQSDFDNNVGIGNVAGSHVIHNTWKEYVDDFKTYLTGRILYMTKQLGADDPTLNTTDVGEMMDNRFYNLAKKKKATVYKNVHQEGKLEYLNDGLIDTGKCPITNADSVSAWGTTGQPIYATIDLGGYYKSNTIDKIVVQYDNSNTNDTVQGTEYKIQYSIDGKNFRDVTVTETATLDENNRTVDDVSSVEGTVRYVRLYVPKINDVYGIHLREFAVLDTDKNAETVESEEVADVTDFVLTTPADNQIGVQFTASATENVSYTIYVDDEVALENAVAGDVNIIRDVKTGKHTVKVEVMNANGFVSKGVSDTVTVTGEITVEDMLKDSNYNLAYQKDWYILDKEGTESSGADVVASGDETISAEGWGDITDGILGSEKKDYSTPKKGTEGTYFTIDLGKEYDAAGIDSVYVWYRYHGDSGCYPKSGGHQIEYSTDNTNFVTVATISGDELEKQKNTQNTSPFAISVDIANAKEEINAVRYVRVYYPEAVTYGAQVTEIAVFDTNGDAKEAETVDVIEAASVTASSPTYNTIQYTITAADGQEGYTYNVTVAGNTYKGVTAGTHTIKGIVAGTYTVTVKSVDLEGNVSKGITSDSVSVKDSFIYTNPKVTTDKTLPDTNDNGKNYLRYIGISATASSGTASNATDGNGGTRWESAQSDPQEIIVDLGAVYTVKEIAAIWETANAKDYTVEVSTDGITFKTVAMVNDAATGERNDSIVFTDTVQARQIKIYGTARNTGYGYSIWEMAVYGPDAQKEYVPAFGPVKDVAVDSYAKWTGKYIVTFKENSVAKSYNVYVDDTLVKNIKGSGYYLTAEDLTGIENGEHTIAVASVNVDGVEAKKVSGTFTVETASAANNDIPQVYISTQGRSISAEYFAKQGDGSTDVNIAVIDNTGKNRDIVDALGDIKIRGNTTAGGEKKPYNIKFNKKQTVLGMNGKAKKWSLLANAFDKSLIRNALVMQLASAMGLDYTSECRFVDVYVNGTYQGNYLLIESVETGAGRIEISDPELTDNNDVVLEIDNNGRDAAETYHLNRSGLGVLFMLGEPEFGPDEAENIALYQDKITNTENLIASFEETLKNDDYNGATKYVDMESFAKFYIVNEVFRNQDFNFSSTRFYVKNNMIYAGPCWDYDLSSGNIGNYYSGEYKDGVTYNSFLAQNMAWYTYLMKNDKFKALVAKYYLQYLPYIEAIYDGSKAEEGYGIDGIENQYKAAFERNYASREQLGAGWNVTDPDQADAYSYANNREWNTYDDAVEFLRDWMSHRDAWLKEQWNISMLSNDLEITGYQISTSFGGENKTGIRTIYQREETVEGQEVSEFGLIIGLASGITDAEKEMIVGSESEYVVSYPSTEDGRSTAQMGDSATALYYVRTMDVAGGYDVDYNARAYAKLADGSIVYSTVTKYNVYDIAKELYDSGKMPNYNAHQSLYDDIISKVDSTVEKIDYNWNDTLVNKPVASEGDVKVEGYQMSSSLYGVEGKVGLRIVYSVEGQYEEAGLVYGLVYGDTPITADDMVVDSSNAYVKAYAATESGKLNVQLGASSTAQYYARTMDVSGLNKMGYTVSYMVRAYAKTADDNVVYSDVYTYTINDVASVLYDNDLMSTASGHNAIYTNILTKVNPDYKEVDYDWSNTMAK